MESASEQWFDEAYYQRFYFDKKTSVVDPAHAARLGAFVCSYLQYVRVPVQRVLDIGCGWGGLSRYIAEVADAGYVKGVTLSTEQLEGAKKRAAASHVKNRLEYQLEDYRDTQGPFDRIVSVGMFEHVGARFHDAFFK